MGRAIRPRCGPPISVAGLRTIEAWRRCSQVYWLLPCVEKTQPCKYTFVLVRGAPALPGQIVHNHLRFAHITR